MNQSVIFYVDATATPSKRLLIHIQWHLRSFIKRNPEYKDNPLTNEQIAKIAMPFAFCLLQKKFKLKKSSTSFFRNTILFEKDLESNNIARAKDILSSTAFQCFCKKTFDVKFAVEEISTSETKIVFSVSDAD